LSSLQIVVVVVTHVLLLSLKSSFADALYVFFSPLFSLFSSLSHDKSVCSQSPFAKDCFYVVLSKLKLNINHADKTRDKRDNNGEFLQNQSQKIFKKMK
jgi:hypothetical protein